MYLSGELENPTIPENSQVPAADFIGPRIKELCDKQQITNYRLSQMTGVTQTVLSRIIKCRLPAQTATCAIFGGHSVT